MAVLITGGARSGKSDFAERYAKSIAAEGIYIATSQSWDEEMEERIRMHRRSRDGKGFPWRTIEEPIELASLLRRLEEDSKRQGHDGRRPVVLVDCLTLWLTNWMLRIDGQPGDKPEGAGGDGDPGKTEIPEASDKAGMTEASDRSGCRIGDIVRNDPGAASMTEASDRSGCRIGEIVPSDSVAAVMPGMSDVPASRIGDAVPKNPDSLGYAVDELVAAVASYSGPLLLVTNEVGSGIVPAYPLGRRFRDEAGRLNRKLAAAAERVFLVVAGIPVDLKALAFRLEDD